MAKRIRCCNNCIYLNTQKEEWKDNGADNFRVGCSASDDGYTKFWLVGNRYKNELNYCGCYCFRDKLKIGDMFHFFTENNEYVCLYCGKVNNKYLIWNQTFRTFKLVEKEWFNLHREQIQVTFERTTKHGCMIITKEEKQRFRKKLAQHRKEVYLKQCLKRQRRKITRKDL